MTGEIENLVLGHLRQIRKDLSEQPALWLQSADNMRLMDKNTGSLEQAMDSWFVKLERRLNIRACNGLSDRSAP